MLGGWRRDEGQALPGPEGRLRFSAPRTVDAGSVESTCSGPVGAHTGSNEWCDGSTQAYDAIFQDIATTVGNNYTVSFWLDSEDTSGTYPSTGDFQQLSTNGDVTDSGGNGIDD